MKTRYLCHWSRALAIALGVSLSSQSNNVGFESTNSTSTVTLFVTPPPTISIAPSLSIAPSTSPPTITYECFGANDDGGENGILYRAVRSYVLQNCANNTKCIIAQTYGWPMNSWCVGNVKDMSYLFYEMDTFNEDINGWNTSSVTNMWGMFQGASLFNRDLSNFDTSSVTDMAGMFYEATSFNQELSNFNTSSVTDMSVMFLEATAFNGDVSNFDTSSVTNMEGMFYGATSYNGDVSNFDTSSVTSMNGMFLDATYFNGRGISQFDTSSVTSMWSMFFGASVFNGDVSNFNTSSVTDMNSMFYGATSFSQNLCSWQDSFPYTNAKDIFLDSGCSYQDTPNESDKGPFCASDCGSLQVSTTSPTLSAVATTTTSNPQQEDECIDTPNYLDIYNGGCDLYALPENEAWCGAYGNDGEVGLTPNENCCVCK